MKQFFQISLTTYIVSILMLSVWHTVTFNIIKDVHPGALFHIAFAISLLFFCFFKYKAIPALYSAQLTTYFFTYEDLATLLPQEVIFSFFNISAALSFISIILTVRLLKWVRVNNFKLSLIEPLKFNNYRYIILVIIISSLFLSILVHTIVPYFYPDFAPDVLYVFIYFFGAVLSCFSILSVLVIIFKTLIFSKLIRK